MLILLKKQREVDKDITSDPIKDTADQDEDPAAADLREYSSADQGGQIFEFFHL